MERRVELHEAHATQRGDDQLQRARLEAVEQDRTRGIKY